MHKILTLDDIIGCKVLLNNNVIKLIDGQPENVISNQIEAEIRALFTKEQSYTMIDEQTRRIDVVFSGKDDN